MNAQFQRKKGPHGAGPRRPRARSTAIAAAVLLLVAGASHAFPIDTGNDDLTLRWDNTVKYGAAWRLKNPSSALTAGDNQDDGNRNFGKGVISSRVDLLSEADVSYKKRFGLRLSGAAWYDRAYSGTNDNNSPSTANNFTVPYNQFNETTKSLHGRSGEVLDAFGYANGSIADAAFVVRLGRHSLLYGESLFFGNNGIAGGQSPLDIIKLLSVPNSQFKEIIRPVNQLSGQVQLRNNLAVGAYYQLEWRKTRIPSAGSYFAGPDVLEGGERFLLNHSNAGPMLYRGADLRGSDSGQGGMQVRWRPEGLDTELGFYAIRYHDKTPQFYATPSAALIGGRLVVFDPANFNPAIGKFGQFQHVYPKGISAYGMSFSTDVSEVNVAGEISIRRNTPLVSDPSIIGVNTAPGVTGGDNAGNPLYAVGNSAHAQLSAIAMMSPTALYSSATFLGEVAANTRTGITKNANALAANSTRTAWAMRFIFEPIWYQVAPGLDLSAPIGVGYSTRGNSSVVSQFNPGGKKGGDLTVGLKGVYQQVWKFGLSYTKFIGSEGTALNEHGQFSFKQYLKDRDYVALSVQRSF